MGKERGPDVIGFDCAGPEAVTHTCLFRATNDQLLDDFFHKSVDCRSYRPVQRNLRLKFGSESLAYSME